MGQQRSHPNWGRPRACPSRYEQKGNSASNQSKASQVTRLDQVVMALTAENGADLNRVVQGVVLDWLCSRTQPQ
eukprot:396789-Amphidinium_carterae.2